MIFSHIEINIGNLVFVLITYSNSKKPNEVVIFPNISRLAIVGSPKNLGGETSLSPGLSNHWVPRMGREHTHKKIKNKITAPQQKQITIKPPPTDRTYGPTFFCCVFFFCVCVSTTIITTNLQLFH